MGDGGEDELRQPLPQPRRYYGRMKSTGEEYGFIDCADTHSEYGRDVYMARSEVPSPECWEVSYPVSFVVVLNEKGRPQARDVKSEVGNEAMLPPPRTSEAGAVKAAEDATPQSQRTTSEAALPPPGTGLILRSSPKFRPQAIQGELWADMADDFGEELANLAGKKPPDNVEPPQEDDPCSPWPAPGTATPSPVASPRANESRPEHLSLFSFLPCDLGVLRSEADLVRALCFRRPRNFLLAIESQLLRLLEAPKGACMPFPLLAPHFQILLRAVCSRFMMQEITGAGGEIQVSVGTRVRPPLPLAALVPGTWAGVTPEEWPSEPPTCTSLAPCPGLRVPVACDLSTYLPDAPPTRTDGDAASRAGRRGSAASHNLMAEIQLLSSRWELVDVQAMSPGMAQGAEGENTSFVTTFSVDHSAAGGGVGFAVCTDMQKSSSDLQDFSSTLAALVGARRGSTTGDPDVWSGEPYVLLAEPRFLEHGWLLRHGLAPQSGYPASTSSWEDRTVPWTGERCTTFWLAVSSANSEGTFSVEVGLDRFPWRRLVRRELRRSNAAGVPEGFRCFGFTALGPPAAALQASVHSVAVERFLCADAAGRAHIACLSCAASATTLEPALDGIASRCEASVVKWWREEVEKGELILAVCATKDAASRLCQQASSEGWSAWTLAHASTDLSSMGGESNALVEVRAHAAESIRRHMLMVAGLPPAASLSLGLAPARAESGPPSPDSMRPATLSQEALQGTPCAQSGSATPSTLLRPTAAEFTPTMAPLPPATTPTAPVELGYPPRAPAAPPSVPVAQVTGVVASPSSVPAGGKGAGGGTGTAPAATGGGLSATAQAFTPSMQTQEAQWYFVDSEDPPTTASQWYFFDDQSHSAEGSRTQHAVTGLSAAAPVFTPGSMEWRGQEQPGGSMQSSLSRDAVPFVPSTTTSSKAVVYNSPPSGWTEASPAVSQPNQRGILATPPPSPTRPDPSKAGAKAAGDRQVAWGGSVGSGKKPEKDAPYSIAPLPLGPPPRLIARGAGSGAASGSPEVAEDLPARPLKGKVKRPPPGYEAPPATTADSRYSQQIGGPRSSGSSSSKPKGSASAETTRKGPKSENAGYWDSASSSTRYHQEAKQSRGYNTDDRWEWKSWGGWDDNTWEDSWEENEEEEEDAQWDREKSRWDKPQWREGIRERNANIRAEAQAWAKNSAANRRRQVEEAADATEDRDRPQEPHVDVARFRKFALGHIMGASQGKRQTPRQR